MEKHFAALRKKYPKAPRIHQIFNAVTKEAAEKYGNNRVFKSASEFRQAIDDFFAKWSEKSLIQWSTVLMTIFRPSIRCLQVEGYGSGRQGRNPTGESPVVTIVRFSHVAIPQLREVTI